MPLTDMKYELHGSGYTVKEISEIVSPIASRYNIKRMWLFGSRARGDNKPSSDYDFCIEADRDMSLFDVGAFFSDVKDALSAEIDLVCEDSLDGTFAEAVSREGKIVYEC